MRVERINTILVIDGETVKYESIDASMSVGALYGTLTIVIDGNLQDKYLGKEFGWQCGEYNFSGVIVDAKRLPRNRLELYARTGGCAYFEPFSDSIDTIEDAKDSETIIEKYESITRYPIDCRIPNVNFGGNIERSGTMGDVIMQIASLVGAMFMMTSVRLSLSRWPILQVMRLI